MPPGVMRTIAFCVGVAPRIAGRNNQVVWLEEVRFGSEEANSRRTGIGVMIMRVLCKRVTMGVTSSYIKKRRCAGDFDMDKSYWWENCRLMAIELYIHGYSEQLIPPPPDTFRCGNIFGQQDYEC